MNPSGGRTVGAVLDFATQLRAAETGLLTDHDLIEAASRLSPDLRGRLQAAVVELRSAATPTPSVEVLGALATALALPHTYFSDWTVTATVDARLVLAHALNRRGIRLIGPCRVRQGTDAGVALLYAKWLNEHEQQPQPGCPTREGGTVGATGTGAPRSQCAAMLHRLGLRPPLTLADLLAATSTHLGRRIRVVPEALPLDGLFGATTTDAGVEVIRYQSRTSVTHQLLIILHELVHILMDHPRQHVPVNPAEISTRLPQIPPAVLHLVLGGEAGAAAAETPAAQALTAARPDLFAEFRAALEAQVNNPSRTSPTALPDVSAALYGEYVEWEAETMATIMMEWLSADPSGRATPRSRRVHASLGDPARW